MTNNKDGSGQTETDELDAILEELGMKVHNTAMEYRAGNLTEKELPEHQAINYAEARAKVRRYSHHQSKLAVQAERDRWKAASMQRLAKYDATGIPPETQALIAHQTEQVLERLKSKAEPMRRGKIGTVAIFDSAVLVFDIDAERERIKEQSLPTNKDKET